MKRRSVLNIKNIASFIDGHSKLIYDSVIGLPDHIKEQVAYRLYMCKDDCLVAGKCIKCGCPPEKKAFTTWSCNEDRFPDMMGKEGWGKFKQENNIDEQYIFNYER